MPFGTIAGAGWASGLNLYGTALLLGLVGRLGWSETPAELQNGWVMGAMALMYALEFVVDKVPWADSAWDAAHTVIRPIGGALISVAFAQDAGGAELIAGLVGGGFSLSAHAAKASTRAAVNTSPEPVSNLALSLAEDGVVAGMVGLALAYPWIAGGVAVVFAVTSVAITWLLIKFVRKALARWRNRRAQWAPP